MCCPLSGLHIWLQSLICIIQMLPETFRDFHFKTSFWYLHLVPIKKCCLPKLKHEISRSEDGIFVPDRIIHISDGGQLINEGDDTLTLMPKQLTGKTRFFLWLECFFKINEQTCPVVWSTDRSKAVVPVLVLLFVALWFILRGDFCMSFRVSFCSCVFQSF